MSRSIWGLIGDTLVSDNKQENQPFDFAQSIKQINALEKDMISLIDAIGEPDYIGDFIQNGGLIGLEPMGYNAPSSPTPTPDVSHARLAQEALNHSRLESALNRFRKSLKETFLVLNETVQHGHIRFDASTQQALADISTHQERAKDEIKSLVLKPKTVETMYACFEKIDQDAQRLQKEFEDCAKHAR